MVEPSGVKRSQEPSVLARPRTARPASIERHCTEQYVHDIAMNAGLLLSVSACVCAQALKVLGSSISHGTFPEAAERCCGRRLSIFTQNGATTNRFPSDQAIFLFRGNAIVTLVDGDDNGMLGVLLRRNVERDRLRLGDLRVHRKSRLLDRIEKNISSIRPSISNEQVCYDASHVRYEVGKHASQLNRLLSSSRKTREDREDSKTSYVDIELQRDEEHSDADDDSAPLVNMQLHGDNVVQSMANIGGAAMTMFLEEAVGHTKMEVVAGVALGVVWFALWVPVLVWTE